MTKKIKIKILRNNQMLKKTSKMIKRMINQRKNKTKKLKNKIPNNNL